MDTQKSTGITHWMKTNKFWTSAIALLLIILVLHAFEPMRLGSFALFNLLYYYILFGGLIWSGYTGKKGMTLVSLGIAFTLLSILSWWAIFDYWEFDAVSLSLPVIYTLLSLFFFFAGFKRYEQWLRYHIGIS
jgi:hypothetical protein